MDRIEASYASAGNRDSATFYLIQKGVQNRLYQTNRPWQRGVLNSSWAALLDQEMLSSELLQACLAQSLVVDVGATVTVVTSGSTWSVSDPVNELLLTITLTDSELAVWDGGVGYELESFDFSQIRYYAPFERWEVTANTGLCAVFGGGVGVDDTGYNTSRGSSICWGVRWNGWSGPSTVTHDDSGNRLQTQYPTAWYISSERALCRDEIFYDYLQDTQLVGSDGLPYTKAIYLGSIVDPLGQGMTLAYGDKEYDASTYGSREYLDPFKAVPDQEPDAYQTRYETRYLAAVTCSNVNGETLYTTWLGYKLQSYCTIPDSAPETFYGDTIKRTLTEITKVLANGSSLPSMRFGYYSANDTNPGALETRVLPEGGVIRYVYQQKELSSCTRSLSIAAPLVSAAPRIWFGPDYAVVIWIDSAGQFSLTVYTWTGRWVAWRPVNMDASLTIDSNDITVTVEDDFFVVDFALGNDKDSAVLFYHKNIRILGGWLESSLSPVILSGTTDRTVVAGDRFIAIVNSLYNTISRLTWDNTAKEWTQDTLATPDQAQKPYTYRIFPAAAANILMVLYYDIDSAPTSKQSLLILNQLSEEGIWSEGDRMVASQITIAGSGDAIKSNLSWTSSAWVFAATYVTTDASGYVDYQVALFTWSDGNEATYALATPFITDCQQDKSSTSVLTFSATAQIFDTGMVVSGPYLLRFNGTTWLANNNLELVLDVDDDTLFWFAAGGDIVLKTENSATRIIAVAQVFDPNTDSTAWSSSALSLYNGAPNDSRWSNYYPTASQDFISFNDQLYNRGTSTNWIDAIQNPVSTLPSGTNNTTLINASPEFMVYQEDAGDTPSNTVILLLEPGFVKLSESTDQNFYQMVSSTGQVDEDPNGQYPAGSDSFVTFLPLDGTLDNAQSITLYRYLNDDLFAAITDYPVLTTTIDDGFIQKIYTYDFEGASAAVDSLGYRCKYYQSSMTVGSNAENGTTSYNFINSVGTLSADNPSQEAGLDGQLASKTLYDSLGTVVSSQSNDWLVMDRFTDALTGESWQLNGVFLQLSQSSNTLDQVTTAQNYSYDPCSGAISSSAITIYNTDGAVETHEQIAVPGYSVYPLMAYLNLLSHQVAMSTTVAVADGEAVVTSQQIVDWGMFSGLAMGDAGNLGLLIPSQTNALLQGDSTTTVITDGTGVAAALAAGSWMTTSQDSRRNPFGYSQEAVDSMGVTRSILYDEKNGLVVAKFVGASVADQEAYYYGFESYEDPGVWILDDSTPLVTTIANTGSQCLSLPPGITGATLVLTPLDRSQVFLFSFWARIDPNASATPVTVWQVNYSSTGSTPVGTTITVTSTEWQYYYQLIDLTGCTEAVTIRLTPTNADTSRTVFIDNVCFATQVGQGRIYVYDATCFYLLAEVGPYDRVKRHVYDQLQRRIAVTDAFQNLQSIIAPYLSRQNQDDFNAAEPNSQLVVQPMGTTCMLRFMDNGYWGKNFTSESPESWISDSGQLQYVGTSPSSITLIDPACTSNAMIAFQWYWDETPGQSLGVILGTQVTITWDPTSGAWTLCDTLNNQTLSGATTQSDPGCAWMLIYSQDAIILVVDGQVIFAYLPMEMPSGNPGLFAGSPVRVSQFMAAQSPQIAMKYFDGAGKPLQGQSIEGDQAVVVAMLYDSLARRVGQVKPVTYDGATQGLIQYRPDVFTSLDWDSGIMTGQAADAWPEDEGYPYHRVVLESSPLARVIEVGAAGKDFAITNMSTTTASDRHTITYSYGCNDQDTLNGTLGWTKGYYYQKTVVDQDGTTRLQFSDQRNAIIGGASLLDDSTDTWLITTFATTYQTTGSTQNQRLPNYYNPPQNSVSADWVISKEVDCQGRMMVMTTPSTAASHFVFNNIGQLRIWQDALASDQGIVYYNKYDTFSRLLETGLVATTWDTATLQDWADDCNWPTSSNAPVVVCSYSLDGDGTVLSAMGQIVSTAKYDENSGECLNTLAYGYNNQGLIASVSQTFEVTGECQTTTYTYDNLGNIAGLTYATGLSLVVVRDTVGRVIAINDDSEQALATYTYRNDDKIITATFLPDADNAVSLTHNFNSPGWLTGISSPYFAESLSYTTGSQSSQGYYSGKIAAVTSSFPVMDTASQFPDTLCYRFDYDSLGRMKVAEAVTDTTQSSWSMGLTQPITFDDNGNFNTLDQGGVVQSYVYEAGTDRVVNTAGGTDNDYQTDLRGAIVSSVTQGIQSIAYELLSQRALTITTADKGDIIFQYDSYFNRILKTHQERTVRTIRGVHGKPLVEFATQANKRTKTTEYLYGPTGLFAIRVDGTMFPVLSDHLRSVRGLIGANAKIKSAYHYSPYGALIATYGDVSSMRYLFTGYGYDHETGLYNASARLYDPVLKRFYSADPKMQFSSPYLYGGNNPVSMVDPSGEVAWWATAVGIAVGFVAALATAGAAAWAAPLVTASIDAGAAAATTVATTASTEEATSSVASQLAVNAIKGGVLGAVGSVSGDATTAGASKEKFTASRAGLDMATGAAGGAVGGALGGYVGARAASFAQETTIKLLTPKTIGIIVGGVVGGVSDAVVATGVGTAISKQHLSSTAMGLNVVIGAALGIVGEKMNDFMEGGGNGRGAGNGGGGSEDFGDIEMTSINKNQDTEMATTDHRTNNTDNTSQQQTNTAKNITCFNSRSSTDAQLGSVNKNLGSDVIVAIGTTKTPLEIPAVNWSLFIS
ncbi:MAG: RHS repeat-associated core domain-containing protein [Magnetococcales bacterium]|nr:RHS repeat-associated core domain-containing protein [Magnetococcales bacterium]